jgi:prepilin-type N-terminal cleavage/methylation domain-containing protein
MDRHRCRLNRLRSLRRTAGRAAFTLLEVLLVVAAIGILSALLIPSTQPNLYEQLDSTAHIVATELAYGRSLAVSNNGPYRFTWDLPNNRFFLQYAGTNSALQTLPTTAFRAPGDPADRHIIDLNDLPHIGPTVQIAAVASGGNSITPITTLDFGPLGGTVSAAPTTIWLSAGSGEGARYISLAVNPVTGLVSIGPFSVAGPPSAAMASN